MKNLMFVRTRHTHCFGLLAAAIIAFWDIITDRPGLSFLWIIPTSLIVHVVVMMTISFIIPPRNQAMKKNEPERVIRP